MISGETNHIRQSRIELEARRGWIQVATSKAKQKCGGANGPCETAKPGSTLIYNQVTGTGNYSWYIPTSDTRGMEGWQMLIHNY